MSARDDQGALSPRRRSLTLASELLLVACCTQEESAPSCCISEIWEGDAVARLLG